MNWIVKFSQLEKECIDKVLDIIASYDEFKNNLLDNVYTEIYKTKPIINNMVEKLNSNSITQEYFDNASKEMQNIADKMGKEYEVIIPKIHKYMKECIEEIYRIKNSTFDEISKYLKSKKEYILNEEENRFMFKKNCQYGFFI